MTVTGAAADVTVSGTAGALNTVTLDRSAISAPATGSVTASGSVTTVAGLLDNAAALRVGLGISSLALKLGSGNNQLSINDAASVAALSATGGISNDAITVVSIPSGKTAAIPGAPVANQFAGLGLSAVDTLVIDNSGYTTALVAFVRSDVPTGTHNVTLTANGLDLVDTTGARAVKVIGGLTGDTLDVVSNSPADESGTVNGNGITLNVGGSVISGGVSVPLSYVANQITFTNLVNNSTTYSEDGNIVVSGFNSTGAATSPITAYNVAVATQFNEVLSLGDPSGSPFSLSSLTLSAFNGNAPATVTLYYTTHDGRYYVASGANAFDTTHAGSITVPVNGAATTFPSLSGLSKVWLTPGANVGVDNIVASRQATAAASVSYTATPTLALSGRVVFNSSIGTVSQYLNGSPNPSGVYNGSSAGFTTSLDASTGIETIRYAGNITFAANTVVIATGCNLLAITAAGDITVGAGVSFDDGSNSSAAYAPTGAGGGGTGGAVAAGGNGGAGGAGGIVGATSATSSVYAIGGNRGVHDGNTVSGPATAMPGRPAAATASGAVTRPPATIRRSPTPAAPRVSAAMAARRPTRASSWQVAGGGGEGGGGSGGRAEARACDVTSYPDVASATQSAVDAFCRLDILVNNAGLIEPVSRLVDSDPADWGRVANVNYKGVYHGLRAAIPIMVAQGGGTIVNISSGAATGALEGWSHYCSSKAAVLSLTRCADKEYREAGVRVIGLSPGTVATGMQVAIKVSGLNPVSRLDPSVHVPAEWVAQAIAWLCTEAGMLYAGTDFSLKISEGRLLAGLPPI